MPISLSHLGEHIVAEMANKKPFEMAKALGITDLLDRKHVERAPFFAAHECKLSPHRGLLFDGASRIDVALWVRPDLALGLELKLGKTRLSKARVDNEFLRPCRLSHGGKRIAGNMMAILERQFAGLAPEEGLDVELNGKMIPLARDWILITQHDVLGRWMNSEMPDFSNHTSIKSIQEIIEAYGGQDPFNELVSEALSFDYFREWIRRK